jgi:arabinofuranosyltransferase
VVTALIVVALAAGFAWQVIGAGPIAIDDAYITFSYSKNLATGHGPVYGHGLRVEGYSNFLWMLLVAVGLLFRIKADPMVTAHWVAVPFMALLAFSTYRLCRLRASRLGSMLAVVMLVINCDIVTAFAIGLESVPAAALLTLSFMLYLGSWRDPRLSRWVVPALTAVALTRIDGFVPLGFVLLFEAGRRLWARLGPRKPDASPPESWRSSLRDFIKWAGPGVAIYIAWFAWRWWYYGMPLPATYYAKALIPKLLPDRGWEYVRSEYLANGAYLVLPFAALLIVRRRVEAIFLIAFSLVHVAYVVKVGGDWMPYGRFLLPLFPLIVVMIIWGGAELLALGRPRLGRWSLVLAALPLAALLFVARRTERHLTDVPLQLGKFANAAEQAAHVKELKSSARLLNRALPPGARLVTDYGGVFAYYTDAAPIEMWGLCNALIATKGGTERINPIYGRTCPECYPQLKPEFFHVWVPITRDPQAFHSHLEVVQSVWQTDTIGRYLDFQRDFVTGRSMQPARNKAVYFLERRHAGGDYRPRTVADSDSSGAGPFIVDYPFEPGGRAEGL